MEVNGCATVGGTGGAAPGRSAMDRAGETPGGAAGWGGIGKEVAVGGVTVAFTGAIGSTAVDGGPEGDVRPTLGASITDIAGAAAAPTVVRVAVPSAGTHIRP